MNRIVVATLSMLLGCVKQSTTPPTDAPTDAPPVVDTTVEVPRGVPGGIPGGLVRREPTPIETTPTTEAAVTPTPEQRARVNAIRDRGFARVTRDARYKAELKRQIEGVTDPTIAYERGKAMGAILSSRGMSRLSDSMLERWMLTRAKFNLSSREACAGLWGGPMSDDALTFALASLDDKTLADFMHVIAEATLAELSATTPLVQDVESLRAGITALQDQLTPEDRDRFAAVLAGTRTTVDDQCFASRVLHDRVTGLPADVRARFIRALAASMAAP